MHFQNKNTPYIDYQKSGYNYEELANLCIQELETVGYILIKKFNIDTANIEDAKNKYLRISELIGKTISHDINNAIIWDIKSNLKSVNFIKTYSEHKHEADLHTDSQYSEYPEDYFGLLTLKKAACGGGLSYLLTLNDVLNELRTLPNSIRIEKTLRDTDFPFIVPNVFKKNKSKELEYNFGPILKDNEIRFRVDTFEKSLIQNPNLCTKEQLFAYNELKKIILNNRNTKKFHLNEKDLIFINNKTMLHGRSEFIDNDRHLLRIRMNKFTKM